MLETIDWVNGVLRRFQQHLNHITATAHIIHVFPGFHQHLTGALIFLAGAINCLDQGRCHEKKPKNRGSSAALAKDRWILIKQFTTYPYRTPYVGNQNFLIFPEMLLPHQRPKSSSDLRHGLQMISI